jgi:hypothetical protein
MMFKIGYLGEPFAPDVQAPTLWESNGEFATYSDVLTEARQTANGIQAHSFVIEWSSGTTDRYVRDGDAWRRLSAHCLERFRRSLQAT